MEALRSNVQLLADIWSRKNLKDQCQPSDLHRQVAVPAAAKPDVAGCRVKHIQVQKMQAAALLASQNSLSQSRVALSHRKALCSCDAHLRVLKMV